LKNAEQDNTLFSLMKLTSFVIESGMVRDIDDYGSDLATLYSKLFKNVVFPSKKEKRVYSLSMK